MMDNTGGESLQLLSVKYSQFLYTKLGHWKRSRKDEHSRFMSARHEATGKLSFVALFALDLAVLP